MASITNARQLGAGVREARKKRGLSQEGLAAQAGVSRAWLTRFETGHPTASIESLFRVLSSLDLSLDLAQRTVTEAEAEAAVLAALAARAKR